MQIEMCVNCDRQTEYFMCVYNVMIYIRKRWTKHKKVVGKTNYRPFVCIIEK